MTGPVNEHFLPIDIETFVDTASDCYIVIGAMSRDFGPWQKGEQKCLTFNFDDGWVREYGEDGVVIHHVDIFLTPLPPGL